MELSSPRISQHQDHNWQFVHDPGRQEASKSHLACTRCRDKKLKCSGETPACSRCTAASIPCTYVGRSRAKAANRTLTGQAPGHIRQEDLSQTQSIAFSSNSGDLLPSRDSDANNDITSWAQFFDLSDPYSNAEDTSFPSDMVFESYSTNLPSNDTASTDMPMGDAPAEGTLSGTITDHSASAQMVCIPMRFGSLLPNTDLSSIERKSAQACACSSSIVNAVDSLNEIAKSRHGTAIDQRLAWQERALLLCEQTLDCQQCHSSSMKAVTLLMLSEQIYNSLRLIADKQVDIDNRFLQLQADGHGQDSFPLPTQSPERPNSIESITPLSRQSTAFSNHSDQTRSCHLGAFKIEKLEVWRSCTGVVAMTQARQLQRLVGQIKDHVEVIQGRNSAIIAALECFINNLVDEGLNFFLSS